MRELNSGESHTMALAPMRVTLTGVGADTGVVLRMVEGGVPAQVHWMSPHDAIVPPVPRTLSVVIEGADGVLIPQGTRVGLAIRAAQGTDPDQVVVLPADVGAKRSVEFAVLTVAPPTITVKVPERVTVVDSGDWSRPGAYAFREAFATAVPASALPWVFAIDGSISMVRRLEQGSGVDAVLLIAGIGQEWMHRAPKAVLRTSPRGPEAVPVTGRYPLELVEVVQKSAAPSSWLHLAPVIRQAGALLTSGGGLVIVADGVPSDVADVLAALREFPRVDVRVVIWGASQLGVSSALQPEWFADDLALLSEVSQYATVVAIADDVVATSPVAVAAAVAAESPVRFPA